MCQYAIGGYYEPVGGLPVMRPYPTRYFPIIIPPKPGFGKSSFLIWAKQLEIRETGKTAEMRGTHLAGCGLLRWRILQLCPNHSIGNRDRTPCCVGRRAVWSPLRWWSSWLPQWHRSLASLSLSIWFETFRRSGANATNRQMKHQALILVWSMKQHVSRRQ